MYRVLLPALLASAIAAAPAAAEPMTIYPGYHRSDAAAHEPAPAGGLARPRASRPQPLAPRHHVRRPGPDYIEPRSQPYAAAPVPAHRAQGSRAELGGGLIEFLFGDSRPVPVTEPQFGQPDPRQPEWHTGRPQRHAALPRGASAGIPLMDPRFLPQIVPYDGAEKPGTVIIDTAQRFLFLVQDDGTARRYGVGVGREGFGWRGTEAVSAKREWPDWRPPAEMLKREPHLPRHMPGGPENPLGARALYLGSTLYRIHGSNEPWTIGQAVSSGCIRMRNEDVIDLYERVRIGTQVKVI